MVGHAFSGMTYYWKMGLDKMYDFYAPIWEQGAKVKMYDSAYAPMFNDFLDQKSIARYDHTCNIYDLIEESSVVVTTGPTSVSVEAALAGRMVLNVLDGSCPEAPCGRAAQYPGLFSGRGGVRDSQDEGGKRACALRQGDHEAV